MLRLCGRCLLTAPLPARRLFSTDAVRPRAVGTVSKVRRRAIVTSAIIGGTAAFLGYVAYQHDFDIDAVVRSVRETLRNMTESTPGDPNVEDLQKSLGPPPPDGYVNVLISIESVLLRREWDRRYGWVYEPREGMRDLLKTLLDPNMGVYLTLWSENSSSVAGEIMEKLMHSLSAPAAHTPPLGVEHMFIRENGKRKEKRLEYFARDPRTVLLIDHNPLSEALNPSNTVLVQPMGEKLEGGGSGAATASPDVTCAAIKALLSRIREDVQASGAVNVPRALARLRNEAKQDGFSTDAGGLYAFLRKQVEAEKVLEREKRETGLGGVLRRTAAASSVLRARATTMEAAAQRPFRDPAWDTGDGSLLATKLRDALAKAGGPPP